MDTDAHKRRLLSRRKTRSICIVVALLFAIFAIDWQISGKKATQRQEAVRNELQQLPPFPSSIRETVNSTFKTTAGVIVEERTVASPESAVEDWYSEEFARLKWKRLSVQRSEERTVMKFCQNNETAVVSIQQDSGANDQATLHYSIQIGWGSPFAC